MMGSVHTAKALTGMASTFLLLTLTACGEQRSVENFCEVVEDLVDDVQDIAGSQDPEDIEQGAELIAEHMGDAADVAPEEIQTETENVAGAYQAITEEDFDYEAMIEDPGGEEAREADEAANEIEAEHGGDLNADLREIDEYAAEHCEADLSAIT